MSALRWIALVLALVVASMVAISIGAMSIAPSDIWKAISGGAESVPVLVVRTLRLPRVALATLIGAGLGMSGAALQGTMRNPLAEPYLLGVSGGAAVGAVVATMLGWATALVPLAALAGSTTGRSSERF